MAYSSTGRVDGISTSVDLDLIYEDLEQNEARRTTARRMQNDIYTVPGKTGTEGGICKMVTVALDQSRRSEIAPQKEKNLDGSFGKRTKQHWWHSDSTQRKRTAPREPDKKCGKKTRAALIAAVKALLKTGGNMEHKQRAIHKGAKNLETACDSFR